MNADVFECRTDVRAITAVVLNKHDAGYIVC